MKKFIIIFLFLNACIVNNTITSGNVKIISSNIRLDLGPGSKGIDYNNLGPSSKGITNLRFNISFPQDITKDLKIEVSKNDQKKFDINLLEINKENNFYINSPDMEKGLYKIKTITSNENKSVNIDYYIEINSNKEIKFDIYNYNEKPELLDISIKSKNF